MKKALLSTLFFGALQTVFAQAPQLQWTKTFGGSQDDIVQAVQQTSDNGFVLAGYTYSADGDVTGHANDSVRTDGWIVKTDTGGTLQWESAIGGTRYDMVYAIQQTQDGGYIAAGATNSLELVTAIGVYTYDFWVVKLNSAGTLVWQKTYGGGQTLVVGGNNGHDMASSIQQTADGGYIVVGGTGSNNGDVTGGHSNNISTGYRDGWIIKIDSVGNLEREHAFGGTGDDNFASVQITTDGNYIVAGLSNSTDGDVVGNHGSYDFWVVKFNDTLGIIWQKSLGGSASDNARAVYQTADGGYLVSGYSSSSDGDVSPAPLGAWVVKLNATGNIEWQISPNDDAGVVAKPTFDNGFVALGSFLTKYDNARQQIWQTPLQGIDVQQTTDTGYVVAGGTADYVLYKLATDTTQHTSSVNTINENAFLLFPNPTGGKFMITSDWAEQGEIEIYNIVGEKILTAKTSLKQTFIDLSAQSGGLYLVKISSGKNVWTKRVVVE